MNKGRQGASGKRVLVVDDERSVRDILVDGLDAFGFETVAAASAAEALEIVRRGGVDLVLTDIEMPNETGFDVLRQVKAHDADLDVVMVTGVVDARTAVQAIRQGASDYVTKPFDLEEVQIIVERTLDKRRLISENRAYQVHLEEVVELRTGELVEKNREVETLYQELEESYEATLQALVTALDFRDNETQGHSYRVVEYAVLVAQRLGVTEPAMTSIRRGADFRAAMQSVRDWAEIAVITHWGFIRGLTGQRLGNCETLRFDPNAAPNAANVTAAEHAHGFRLEGPDRDA